MDELIQEGTLIDIALFDSVASKFNDYGPEGDESRDIITQIMQRADAWLQSHKIIKESQSDHSKFLALNIFANGAATKWDLLSTEQRDYFRSFFYNLVLEFSVADKHPSLRSLANSALIAVIKNEWPFQWPELTHNIIVSSRSNDLICMNNLSLLSSISDEIHSVKDLNLTCERRIELETALEKDFQLIFSHLEDVISQSQTDEMRAQALLTLSKYLQWADLRVIVNSQLCQQMVTELFPLETYRIPVLSCFAAIANHDDSKADSTMFTVFSLLVQCLQEILATPEHVQAVCDDPEQAKYMVYALNSFILLDSGGLMQSSNETMLTLNWLAQFTAFSDQDSFSYCIEAWHTLSRQFLFEKHKLAPPFDILEPLQTILFERMVRPPQFCIVIVEDRIEYVPETETIDSELFLQIRQTLVFLRQLSGLNKVDYLLERLTCPFSLDLLPFYYSAGAISGTAKKENENEFIIPIFNNLISQFSFDSPTLESNFIAACFIYLCSQYTRVLYLNPVFLKDYVNKLFEMIGVMIPPLQAMAISVLENIATICHEKIHQVRMNGTTSLSMAWIEFINSVVTSIPSSSIPKLFSGAIALLKSGISENTKNQLLSSLFSLPYQTLESAVVSLQSGSIDDHETSERLVLSLDVLSKIIASSGESLREEIEKIVFSCCDLLNLYTNELKNRPDSKSLENVKSHVLLVIESYFTAFPKSEHTTSLVNHIIEDFKSSNSESYPPGTLSCLSALCNQLKGEAEQYLSQIIDSIVVPVYELINASYSDYPDLRTNYFSLMSSILTKVYTEMPTFDSNLFSKMINSMLWGLTHPQHDISLISLGCISEIVETIDRNEDDSFRSVFYETFYIQILLDLFTVLTDPTHKFAFGHLTHVLHHMLQLAQTGRVSMSYDDPREFISQSISEKLQEIFPNRDPVDLINFAQTIVNDVSNLGRLRDSLSDFLITMKKASPKDKDLFKFLKKEQEDADNEKIPWLNGPSGVSETGEPVFFDEESQLTEF